MKVRRLFWMATIAIPVLIAQVAQQAPGLLSQAPPDVDEALRARTKEFYELQMQGKFRASEALVCEDSKDAYYGGEKRRWTSIDIQRIDYAEGFRDAKVTTALGSEFVNRAGRMPVIFPFTSLWRVENDKWCYYVPPPGSGEALTPFGVMRSGNATQPAAPAPPGKPVDPNVVMNAVRLSTAELHIPLNEPSRFEVVLENTLQGNVSLRFLPPPIDGLVAKLTKSELGPGEKATLTVTFQPGPKPPGTSILPVRVEPIGQSLAIKLTFRPASER